MAGCRLRRGHRQLVGIGAKGPLDRTEFDDVGHGRRAMGVDVVDLVRAEVGALESGLHGAHRTVAVFRRSGNVIGVARQAVAEDLGVDLRTALLRVLVLLEHKTAGALAHYEAVALPVPGPRRLCRGVVEVGRQCLAGVEARDADAADRGFGTARHHHIGILELDQPRGITDRVRTGGAGGDDRVVRSLEAVLDGNLAGDQVDQRRGNEEGTHSTRSPLLKHERGLVDGLETTDAGADHDAGPGQTFLVLRHPARILDRLLGGRESEHDELVELPLLLGRKVAVHIEVAVCLVALGHLTRDSRREIGRIESLDGANARLRRHEAAPVRVDAVTQRRHHTHAGYDDSPHLPTSLLQETVKIRTSRCP